ncbi:BMP family protein [Pseudorhodoferax sp.]|uniref:BMP family protein n=1 Tax=Pseudorhodoferax sp. TaxID=1993553 RepID=UPI0039E36FDE
MSGAVQHRQPAPGARRRLLLGAGALAAPWLAGCAGGTRAAPPARVAALFAGNVRDGGFMEAGRLGLERAAAELGVQTRYLDAVPPVKAELARALETLAQAQPDLVIAHGGQNNEACAEVAARHPRLRFAVTQGAVRGANLASYDVLQEESAYLAGVLAASISRTRVVGHMSGIRVAPGLKGRAAYAAGVRDTDPGVRLLTNFSGNQDDEALSRRVALAQFDAGADVVFTMLNAGRGGVTEACRLRGRRQIGNVVDWTARDPAVFAGSAMADVGSGLFDAVRDLLAGRFPAGEIRTLGLAQGGAVRLAMAPDVPAAARARVEQAAAAIVAGRLHVPTTYAGPEFATPA